MSSKLYFVEGLPGAGKSTFAYRLQRQLYSTIDNVVYYKEETSQPVCLFRQAIIPKQSYESLSKLISDETAQSMELNSYLLEKNVVVAYTKVQYSELERKTIFPQLRAYDIGDGRVPFDTYKKLHFQVWSAFVRNYGSRSQAYITEGAFLHNQLLDILGFYDVCTNEILTYYKMLTDIIRPLPYKTYLLLSDDIEKLVRITLQERGIEPNSWGAGFFKWMNLSPYCKKNNLNGISGMVDIYEKLETLSIQILDYIGGDYEVIIRND